MKKTKSIFEIKQQFENIKYRSHNYIRKSFIFYNHACRELLTFESKLIEKSMTYLSSQPLISKGYELLKQEKPDVWKDVQKSIEGINIVDHYSKYNIFVWVKRYHKFYKELKSALNENKEYSRYLLMCLKELNDDLQPHQHKKIVTEMLSYIDVLREDLLRILSFKFEAYDCYSLIIEVFLIEPKINKNNFLSLINTNKEKSTLEFINNRLPEELSIEDFENAIFIEKIEDDFNCYLANTIVKHILKARNNNPSLAKEMDEKIGIDMIPTKSVKFDEYGEVSEIKQNPPKLKLVK